MILIMKNMDVLCIDKRFQSKGYGSVVLDYIISIAHKFSNLVGCRYLVLNSVREYYKWYKARGFTVSNIEELKNDSPTISMYIDFRDNVRIEEYFSEGEELDGAGRFA